MLQPLGFSLHFANVSVKETLKPNSYMICCSQLGLLMKLHTGLKVARAFRSEVLFCFCWEVEAWHVEGLI